MESNGKCILCCQNAVINHSQEMFGEWINCPFCGRFVVPLEQEKDIEKIKHLLAGYLIETKNIKNKTNYTLDQKAILQILSSPIVPQRISDKFYKILSYLNVNCKFVGDMISIPFYAVYAINPEELHYISCELKRCGLLIYDEINRKASPTLKGYEYVENHESTINVNQCFIAMWFDEETNDLWEKAIKPGCLKAGYNPVRIDKHQHNNNIVDEILAGIRRSRFLIADFTGQNRGVYYEAGFAKGFGKEVIQLCRKDHFEKKMDKDTNKPISELFMHFDNAQTNTFIWEEGKEEAQRDKIQFRIESIFGHGQYQED